MCTADREELLLGPPLLVGGRRGSAAFEAVYIAVGRLRLPAWVLAWACHGIPLSSRVLRLDSIPFDEEVDVLGDVLLLLMRKSLVLQLFLSPTIAP